ncbi:carboxylesterase [Hyaloraphidium curvatum]|nr:carboxylesterase [Hyaloraphidium curvatum]
MSSEKPVVQTSSGPVRGTRENGSIAFHGVPFAAAPLGPLRFAAPHPPEKWTDVRDCTAPGPSAPQNASRLDAVMGIAQFARSEDCLHVSLWTPAADRNKRPVLVWLHGGAYMSGGANQPFYNGARLAASEDLVVVGVNYRLGAVGWLLVEGAPAPANRGLLDQIAALRWVRDNVAAFGGDPDNVTVAGQSAGAGSLLALMVSPEAQGLFHKGISQSGPGANLTLEEGRNVASTFFEKAGLKEGDLDALASLDISAMLSAQGAVVADYAARGIRAIPWQPVVAPPSIPVMPVSAVSAGALPEMLLIFGWTHDEFRAWHAQDPRLVSAASLDALKEHPIGRGLPSAAWDGLAKRLASDPSMKPWEALSGMMTDAVFGAAAVGPADARAAAGCETWVYRWDWHPGTAWKACHCIELPLVFGNLDGWPASPMMEGADRDEVERVAKAVRGAWGSFAREGRPVVDGGPEWPARGERKAVLVFGKKVELEG